MSHGSVSSHRRSDQTSPQRGQENRCCDQCPPGSRNKDAKETARLFRAFFCHDPSLLIPWAGGPSGASVAVRFRAVADELDGGRRILFICRPTRVPVLIPTKRAVLRRILRSPCPCYPEELQPYSCAKDSGMTQSSSNQDFLPLTTGQERSSMNCCTCSLVMGPKVVRKYVEYWTQIRRGLTLIAITLSCCASTALGGTSFRMPDVGLALSFAEQ